MNNISSSILILIITLMVKKIYNDYINYHFNFHDFKKEEIEEVIMMNKWTTCKERLPEKDGMYLVTYRNGVVGIDKFIPYINDWANCMKNWRLHVIAWMELPKPYKGSESNE